jgi:hypothetical protein
MLSVYDDQGVRFRYPAGWGLEVTHDGPRATVSMQDEGGTAFLMVTLDSNRPDPEEMADEALEAMRAEYPELEDEPARATIAGFPSVGHDLEFLSLDMGVSCTIRSFRTPRRTVLVFEQWSDLDDQAVREPMADALRSFEETDG